MYNNRPTRHENKVLILNTDYLIAILRRVQALKVINYTTNLRIYTQIYVKYKKYTDIKSLKLAAGMGLRVLIILSLKILLNDICLPAN